MNIEHDGETIALIKHYAYEIAQGNIYIMSAPERNRAIVAMADRLFTLARSLPKSSE